MEKLDRDPFSPHLEKSLVIELFPVLRHKLRQNHAAEVAHRHLSRIGVFHDLRAKVGRLYRPEVLVIALAIAGILFKGRCGYSSQSGCTG